jgi:spore maturation protein CgeB
MKILYCSWNENSFRDTLNYLKKTADEVIVMQKDVKEYLDGRAAGELADTMSNNIDIVFSYDFLPMVSDMCSRMKKIYVSWIYDWPNYTLFQREVYNECNRIYLFERDGIDILNGYRVDNLYYMPLAVDTERLDRLLGTDIAGTVYQYDVSFVGNMYLKKNEAMLTDNIPPYYSGFIDALSNAQQKVFGYNFINEIVDKDFTKDYLNAIGTTLQVMNVPDSFVLANQINRLITGQERRNLLRAAAAKFKVDLFTQGSIEDIPSVNINGGVEYCEEMPRVFRNSKINLNITTRSITSGVPLRVFDILGSGGFCLTNYQAGIAEHFKDGRDLVMYSSPEDMLDKIEYYLSNDKERTAIAVNGHEKVKEYSYERAFSSMLP